MASKVLITDQISLEHRHLNYKMEVIYDPISDLICKLNEFPTTHLVELLVNLDKTFDGEFYCYVFWNIMGFQQTKIILMNELYYRYKYDIL